MITVTHILQKNTKKKHCHIEENRLYFVYVEMCLYSICDFIVLTNNKNIKYQYNYTWIISKLQKIYK